MSRERRAELPIPSILSRLSRIGGICRYNDRVRVVLSTWVGSIYRVGSSRYIDCEVVDLSTGADSFYRLADVDISPSRLSADDHPAPLAFSAGWLREVGTPVWKGSACRQGRRRRADLYQPSLPTWARRPAEMPPPSTPTLPPPTGGDTLRPARRNPPPYMAGLSALLDETLRPTCIKVRRRVIGSKAESCLKYGGEAERSGRRVVRTWSESLAGLMRRYPTPLAISVNRPGDFGGPTAALRLTDIAHSVDRLHPSPGEPSRPAKGRISTLVWSNQ